MASQDFLAACLSIDPVTGALEPEGLCCEVGAKLRMHLDGKTGKLSVAGNETGGGEGAKKRAAHFKQLVNERVARNGEERALLAWVYQDPVFGKSLEEWLWTGRLVVNEEKVGEDDGGLEGAYEMHWAVGEGEGGKEGTAEDVEVMPIEHVAPFALQEAQWASSLVFLAVSLGGVWTHEMHRLVTMSKGNLTKGGQQDPLALSRLDSSLNRRLSNLAVALASQNKLVWLKHEWLDGDTFSLTLLDPAPDMGNEERLMRACSICDEERPNALVGLAPCSHDLCEPCWHRHWDACKHRKPLDPVRCPFCKQVVTGIGLLDLEAAAASLPFFKVGGSIVTNFISVMQVVCEALQLACQATDEGAPAPLFLACQAGAALDRGGGWQDGGDGHVVPGGWVEARASGPGHVMHGGVAQ